MTKPLPIGSINKLKKITSMREFDLIIHGMLVEDKIGHLFLVNTKFDSKNVSKKQLFFK